MHFSYEEKITILAMRELPTVDGKAFTVSEICNRIGLSENTFYRWTRIRQKEGDEGLRDKHRIGYLSQSKKPKVLEMMLEAAKQHPDWSPGKIVDHLAKAEIKISIPTIRARLGDHNLGTQIERFAALEKLFFQHKEKMPVELSPLLRKHNPCFDDYLHLITDHRNKVFVGIIKFDLPKLSNYRLLVGIDMQSNFACVQLLDKEEAKGKANSFKKAVISFFYDRYYDKHISIFYNPKSYYKEYYYSLNNEKTTRKFSSYDDKRKNAGVYENLREALRADISNAFENGLTNQKEELTVWISNWVAEYNSKPGKINYPNFGKSPFECLQVVAKILPKESFNVVDWPVECGF